MTFATRADLLARSSARRLGQLAVPTDVVMPLDEQALRVAITGGSLSGYAPDEQAALTLALAVIDQALEDAAALIVGYGVPATARSRLLARLNTTIAMFYLQGAEHDKDDVSKAYDGAIATLKSHARGEINLLPVSESVPPLSDDQVLFSSRPRRYGADTVTDGDWD